MILKIVTWLAIYLMIWWITLFAVLPIGGNISHHEAGAPVIKGNDPGAPIRHNLWWKVKLNSVVALVVWLVLLILMYVVHVNLPDFLSQH
jgi:predicted secreted protein